MEEMTDDTILFVFGDHGMTKTGDHGGDSKEEVDAALFVFSPQQITASPVPAVCLLSSFNRFCKIVIATV